MASSELGIFLLSIFLSTQHSYCCVELSSILFSLLHSIPQTGSQHAALPLIARAFPKKGLLGAPKIFVLARNPQLCAHPAKLGMLASRPHQDSLTVSLALSYPSP